MAASIRSSSELPPEIREALEQGVEIPGMGVVKHGGADPRKRGILQLPSMSASVLQHNAYVEHLKSNIIGYVTFLGTSSPDGTAVEHIHQFESANGEKRTLMRHISEPVYFKEDLLHFAREARSRNPIFMVSEAPLDPARLERRSDLTARNVSFNEIVNIARELRIVDPQKFTREKLIEQILDVEFKSDEDEDETAAEDN